MNDRLKQIIARARINPPIGYPSPGLRASAQNAPVDAPLVVLKTPSFAEQREAFLALSEEDQQEQIELHMKAVRSGGDIRPQFSDLLYAMGVADR